MDHELIGATANGRPQKRKFPPSGIQVDTAGAGGGLAGTGPEWHHQPGAGKAHSGNCGRAGLHPAVDEVEEEVRRLEALGASRLTPAARQEFGQTWFVLADPEGNEFCLAHDPSSDMQAIE
jgi:predicted enzyme related to lactoylglutathione lyase